ncbi:MAG: glycosyltransferase family 4 protein [Candidatus Methylomirabilis sp.]
MKEGVIGSNSKVKVLHVITRLILGGAQQNTMITASGLDPQHFDVTLVSGPQTGPEGTIFDEVQRRGVRVRILKELVREINPLKDLQALARLYWLIRIEGFDIVHTHSSKAGILGRLAAWLAHVPVVVHTVHGWGFHDQMWAPQRWLFVRLERWAALISDKLIVVSNVTKAKGLQEKIGTPEQFVTIYSGIEPKEFTCPAFDPEKKRRELGIPSGVPVIGTIGRLSPQKAPGDLLAAARKVVDAIPEARFVIVGDGPLRRQVEQSIRAMGFGESIVLTGIREDVTELMTLFDIFVLASRWEGLPRVIPQAMAAGKPVVCTNVDGNSEAVTDGVNGFVVPPRDPEALCNAILTLLRNPSLIKTMGQEGRKGAAIFCASVMVEAIEVLYHTLCFEKLGRAVAWRRS